MNFQTFSLKNWIFAFFMASLGTNAPFKRIKGLRNNPWKRKRNNHEGTAWNWILIFWLNLAKILQCEYLRNEKINDFYGLRFGNYHEVSEVCKCGLGGQNRKEKFGCFMLIVNPQDFSTEASIFRKYSRNGHVTILQFFAH